MIKHLLLAIALCACTVSVDESNAVFGDRANPQITCGLGIDSPDIPIRDLSTGMARALDRGEVLHLFAHRPGVTIAIDRLDAVLAAANQLGLPFVTYAELPYVGAGLALGFDDAWVDDWYAVRELLGAHGARVTFFVSNFDGLAAEQLDKLHELAARGHAIEAHGMGHRNAADYADLYGLSTYLAVEIDPLLARMRSAGFDPISFAYPYGDRTTQLDDALLARFRVLRSVTYLNESVLAPSPCQRD